MEENKNSAQENTSVPKSPQKDMPVVPAHAGHAGEETHGIIMQTYKSDLSKALDTTEADVVQQLLKTARDKENFEKETIKNKIQRSWYTVGALAIMVLAIAISLFAFFYYKKLTVPAEKNFSVGIFQRSSPVVASGSSIENIFTEINSSQVFPDSKPILFNIVSDDKTFSEINKFQFFDFLKAKVTEPFAYQIQVIKLGEVNNGEESTPFIIMSVVDPEIASKEFLIMEPDLLNVFHKALNINLSSHKEQIGESFESNYFYNLPVRILYSTDRNNILMFYGYATPNTVVITTRPDVFKIVYDTIIKQI